MSFNRLLRFFLLWRVLIFVLAIPAFFFLPLRSGFTLITDSFSLSNLALLWGNFDGIHYLSLVDHGFTGPTSFLHAFFPFYPLLAEFFTSIIPNSLLASLLVSNLSFLAALYLLYKLISLDFGDKTAFWSVILLLIFPTSFFFGAVHSEPLFLLLAVASFYSARKGNWFLAALCVSLATATRLIGIFLIPALIVEFIQFHDKNIKKVILDPRLVWFSLMPLGFLAFLRHLYTTTGDAFYFAHVQPRFGAIRELDRVILLYQVVYRYFRMVIFVDHTDPLFFTILLELFCGILFLVLLVAGFKRLRLSYLLYSLGAYLLPTFTGSFSSFPRYVLIIFPGFLILSLWFQRQSRNVQIAYITISTILGVLALSFFSRGYFIG